MNPHHLSDSQIQAYLDDKTGHQAILVEKHLSQCPRCREELALYRDLYITLEKDRLPALPFDFADRIISSLPAATQNVWEKLESGFMVTLILFTLAVSFYFVNPLPLLTEMGNSLLQSLPAYGFDLLSKLNGNLPFILIALLIFFLIELFDKKLLKPKI